MIKAVIFDLDGVLVDACNWHYIALNKALKEIAGTTIEWEEHINTFNGLPSRTKLNILAEQGRVLSSQFDQVYNAKQKYTIQTIKEKGKEDPTKVYLLDKLISEGIKTGCVTNAIRETTTLMLMLCGVYSKLECIITNEDVVNPKPNPEGYITAMKNLNVEPHETLILEDSPKGRQAATSSGANILPVKNATEVTWDLVKEYLI